MKHSKLIVVIFALTIIFFGCSKDNTQLAEPEQVPGMVDSTQTNFTGRSDFVVHIYPGDTTFLRDGVILVKGSKSEWYEDALSCWEITGRSFWTVNQLIYPDGNAKLWGKAEILVDCDKGQGKWELSWNGILTPTKYPDGIKIVAFAHGFGKEGIVKGKVGKWTYTMKFDHNDPTTFFYTSEGYFK
ncbi:MAG: hypothetical protein GXO86_02705 [Chlorobi bacterium]|nr:hypothetical protein [Chlorobiota bacterium]